MEDHCSPELLEAVIKKLEQEKRLLQSALQSYRFGNHSPDLAEEVLVATGASIAPVEFSPTPIHTHPPHHNPT